MGYQHEGRHRAPTKSISKPILSVLLITLLPISIVLGYLSLTTDSVSQIESVNPYAGTITIAASPLTLTPPPGPSTSQAPPAEIPGTDHTTDPNGSSPAPTQSATESPESTAPPTTQQKDSKPAQTSSEPAPPQPKVKASSKCANLDSEENVVRACNAVMAAFPQVTEMGGRGDRPKNPHSCHPPGMGLDVMVSSNELGDSIVKWISSQSRKKKLEIAYVGWEVPDHYSHIHLSFEPCKG